METEIAIDIVEWETLDAATKAIAAITESAAGSRPTGSGLSALSRAHAQIMFHAFPLDLLADPVSEG